MRTDLGTEKDHIFGVSVVPHVPSGAAGQLSVSTYAGGCWRRKICWGMESWLDESKVLFSRGTLYMDESHEC